MDLLDLLRSTGGESSVGQLADAIGLGSDDAGKLIGALAPALMGGLAKNSAGDGLENLTRALDSGGHDRYIDQPELMRSDDTRRDGNKILGHILGSKDVSRKVAANAEQETGISADLIKKALPLLATLAMGAMKKQKTTSSGGLSDLIGMARKFF